MDNNNEYKEEEDEEGGRLRDLSLEGRVGKDLGSEDLRVTERRRDMREAPSPREW